MGKAKNSDPCWQISHANGIQASPAKVLTSALTPGLLRCMSLIYGDKEPELLGIGRFDFVNIDAKWSANLLAISDVSVPALRAIL